MSQIAHHVLDILFLFSLFFFYWMLATQPN